MTEMRSARGKKCLTLLVVVGLGFTVGGARLAAQEGSDAEAGAEEKVRLAPVAQQFIEAAKERLAVERRAKMEQALERQRQKAQKVAVEAAREKIRTEAARQREAERQLKLVRGRQLKSLYKKGQALFRQRSYDEAIKTLEQVVVMDPDHPLVSAAERLITRADLKRFEQRLRASTGVLPPQARGAVVAELQDLLMHKQIEMDTLFQYARVAIRERRYDTAVKLLTAVLVQDPRHRGARNLMEQVQLARLDEEEDVATSRVEQDEAAMINEVIKAQIIPEFSTVVLPHPGGLLAPIGASPIAGKLRELISFEFNQVALGDVLEFLADAANVSIIPSPGLDLKSRPVTLKVKEMPIEQAIKYLTKSLSLAYRVDQDAILIATAEEFSKEPMETRVLFLRNGLSPFALETAAIEPNAAMGMDSIKDLILQAVPQPSGSRLVLDQRTGALIVTNTSEYFALTQRLLSQLDVTPVQVLIEARFVELTLTELDQSGFEWLLSNNVALDKTGSGDGTRRAAQEIASSSGFTFKALTREGEGLNLTLEGILTGTQFEAVLHFLEESTRSKTLSAPRITTLNNQTATIRVVDEFRYPTRYEVSLIQFDINGDGDFDDAGETEFANVPMDFQKRDVGILLSVTPSVGKDMRTITLVLAPEVSQFSQFRDLGGDVTVPEFTSSQLTTSIMIEDGQTVILGGLMKDTTTVELSKIPVLGDLPIIGGLFRQRENKSTRKSLLIFITANIIGPAGQTT